MKILVADDHSLFRDGLKFLLKDISDEVLFQEAGDIAEVNSQLERESDFSLILLDIRMPGMNGISGLKELVKKISIPIVVVSAVEDRHFILQAIDSGARGYVPKTLNAPIFQGALALVLAGGTYLPPQVLLSKDSQAGLEHGKKGSEHQGKEGKSITPRQFEVLQLLAEGKSNREISGELQLSEFTVKLHVTGLLKSLEVNNRTQAVLKAAKMRLISFVN